MLMNVFPALYLILLINLCSGRDSDPQDDGNFWVLITSDCMASIQYGDVAQIGANVLTFQKKGDCEDARFTFYDSTLIVGTIASKTSLRLASVPVIVANASINGTDGFGFGDHFTEVDHSFVLDPYCSYNLESFALFVDMNVLYTVADCQFPGQAQSVGALIRSLIQTDGIVNTPAGPLIYFDRMNMPAVAGIIGNSNRDAFVLRYRFNGNLSRLEIARSELHKINKTTEKDAKLNVPNMLMSSAQKPMFVAIPKNFSASIMMHSVRLDMDGKRVFFGSINSRYLNETISSPGLVFAVPFTSMDVGETFREFPKLLAFTVGRRDADWWTVEYEKRVGDPGSCSRSMVQQAVVNSEDRENQLTTLTILYWVVAFEMTMFAVIIGPVVGLLIYYVKTKNILPNPKRRLHVD